MAIRNLRLEKDEILKKKSREVEKIDDKIQELIDDMIETMYKYNGVGLSAVQVGILKRVVVIDIDDENGTMVFINPEILETSGTQCGEEGCLSVPGEFSEVERPNYVKVKALNEKGEEFILEGEGLLARAILHENDHLDGKLYIDYVK